MDSSSSQHLAATPADLDFNMQDNLEAVRDPLESLSLRLKEILALKLPALEVEARELIPAPRLPSTTFLDSLSLGQKQDALRGCMLVFILSKGKAVPRDFQLQACLGPLAGRDTILCSGTGSGKTLVLILLLLLRPRDVSLLIVPLKRLQLAQASGLLYGSMLVLISVTTAGGVQLVWHIFRHH
jgi:hypothetical protein